MLPYGREFKICLVAHFVVVVIAVCSVLRPVVVVLSLALCPAKS